MLDTLYANIISTHPYRTTAQRVGTPSDELCCLQILPGDGRKHYLADLPDVAGVSGRCEVGVNDLVFVVVSCLELAFNELAS